MSVAEALGLMIDFAGFIVSLLTFIVTLIVLHNKKK